MLSTGRRPEHRSILARVHQTSAPVAPSRAADSDRACAPRNHKPYGIHELWLIQLPFGRDYIASDPSRSMSAPANCANMASVLDRKSVV